MPPLQSREEAEAEALRRFAERAEEFRDDLEQAWADALPGNQSVAETVMLAHLMTANDGYQAVNFVTDWEKRPRSGWTTSLAFIANLEGGLFVPFAFEVRYDEHARQLVLIIDWNRPGERIPAKLQHEKLLIAQNYRLVSFTEPEILSDPASCRDRVECILFEMVDDVLADAGVIRGRAE